MPVVETDPDQAKRDLEAAGADLEAGNTEHERWRATLGEAVAVAYADSVVVQGSRPADIVGVLGDGYGRAYLYFDGASRGNPGPAAVGWVLVDAEGVIDEQGRRIGRATNNEAEYRALLDGLEAADRLDIDALEIYGDSEVIVRQVRGEYDVKAPHLKELRVTARELLDGFDDWSLEAVPREVNRRADDLANAALDAD